MHFNHVHFESHVWATPPASLSSACAVEARQRSRGLMTGSGRARSSLARLRRGREPNGAETSPKRRRKRHCFAKTKCNKQPRDRVNLWVPFLTSVFRKWLKARGCARVYWHVYNHVSPCSQGHAAFHTAYMDAGSLVGSVKKDIVASRMIFNKEAV